MSKISYIVAYSYPKRIIDVCIFWLKLQALCLSKKSHHFVTFMKKIKCHYSILFSWLRLVELYAIF